MKPLAQNTLLENRYLIVHLIGRGGMGEVYLAVDQRLGSPVALKRTFFSDDEMLGSAFEREARTLARLRHPVLPKVIDHFSEGDDQFLVMEHISGDDLSKRLAAIRKPFPLSWVLFWADQLLDALTYLHSNEPPIIHRDIKPQNLKLTDENHIVLLDFGLAKNTVGQTRVTSSGSVVGYTPHYAPMEQIRGTGTNPRSDIYSLSATLYQLLSNIVPPDALTRADALLNDQPDPLGPLDRVNAEVPKVISEIIMRGISVSQEKRFATARDMQKALRDAYTAVQNAMGAETLAFVSPEDAVKEGITESQRETEEIPAPVIQGEIPAHLRSDSAAQEKDEAALAFETSEDALESAKKDEPKDFDATLQYDSKVMNLPEQAAPKDAHSKPADEGPKQSDVKTEVLIGGQHPELDEVRAKYSPPDTAPAADTAREEQRDETVDGSAAETVPGAGEELPDWDASFVKSAGAGEEPRAFADLESDSDQARTEHYYNFGRIPPEDTKVETFTETETGRDGETTEDTDETPFVPAPEKSSTGKYIGIAAGAGLLLFVIIGSIVGIGLYMFDGFKLFTTTVTPTPTLQPTPQPTPVLEEFPVSTPAEDSNIEVPSPSPSPEPTVVTEDQSPSDTRTRPTPVRATPRPTQVVTKRTPRPTPEEVKTPAPKKTPAPVPTIIH